MREDEAVSSRGTRCLVAQNREGETRWVSHRFSRAVHASPAREPVLGKRGSVLGLWGRAGVAGATAAPWGRARSRELELLREPPGLSGEASRPPLPRPQPRPLVGNDRREQRRLRSSRDGFWQGRHGMGLPGLSRERHWLHAKTRDAHTKARR